MFRKLVSNLPFSPALVHDVGFYAKRLRNEEATRRLTLVFVALAIAMQSLTMFSPPESANASSEQDIIPGGVTSLDDFLLRYDHNKNDIKDILNTLGITRAEISASKSGTIRTTDNLYVMTRYGQFGSDTEEAMLSYQRSVGGVETRYISPLHVITNRYQTFDGWIGQSAATGWFGIMKSNGSIATRGIPPAISSFGTEAQAIKKSIRSTNLTQELNNAANGIARPLDKISYTLTAKNISTRSTAATFSVHLSDLIEYSTLIDGGGGSVDGGTLLSWPQVDLKPGETQERTFVVRMLARLPTTPTGSSNPSSHDCAISVTYGDNLKVPVDCPAVKTAEGVIGQLPTTGIFMNLVFASFLAIVAVYFYMRTRQMKKEIRIIRHNINTGII
jgi:hypothetical protein